MSQTAKPTDHPIDDIMGTIRGLFADVLPAEQLDALEADIARQSARDTAVAYLKRNQSTQRDEKSNEPQPTKTC